MDGWNEDRVYGRWKVQINVCRFSKRSRTSSVETWRRGDLLQDLEKSHSLRPANRRTGELVVEFSISLKAPRARRADAASPGVQRPENRSQIWRPRAGAHGHPSLRRKRICPSLAYLFHCCCPWISWWPLTLMSVGLFIPSSDSDANLL